MAWSAKVDWEKTRVALDDKLVKYEYFDLRSLSSFQRHDTTQAAPPVPFSYGLRAIHAGIIWAVSLLV